MFSRFARALGPEPLLFAVAIALASWSSLERVIEPYVNLAPHVVAITGLLVAWRLRRSRLFFAILVLGLSYLLVSRWAPRNDAALQLAAILVPLNLAAIALLPGRGVLTAAGLWQWGALLAQVLLVYVALDAGELESLRQALSRPILSERWTAWTSMHEPAIAAFALSATLVTAGRIWARATTGRGYLWAVAAGFLALHSTAHPVDQSIYFAAAGAILVVAAIEMSYVLAYHDSLTGLPSRRAMSEALERLSDRYTVAMVDVDRFKRFNDTYGHDVGDQVLRTVAARLTRALPGAMVFRYGGEEFAVVLEGKSREESMPLLERARRAVEAEQFTIRGRIRPRKPPRSARAGRPRQRETITVSIGLAERDSRLGDPEDVIRVADKALYRAKSAGRNQVRGATE